MALFLRLLAPAALLGAALLLGERPANPPEELPALSLSAAADELAGRGVPCPGLIHARSVVLLPLVRLPPLAAAGLTVSAPAPEPRSLSPPAAV